MLLTCGGGRTLWLSGYIQALTGPGLAMLLILLAEQAGEGKSVWISPPEFEARYGVSEKTRTAGTKDLQGRGLLIVRRQGIGVRPGSSGSVFDIRRTRNVYRPTPIAYSTPPEL